ncbi:MAG TPA: SDR family NAD(P)-dependent oxidoreductase, partial [Polyangiaceae bacterium]
NAVAERFGREGFAVAIVGRNGERLAKGVEALKAKGVEAASFTCDIGDTAAVAKMIADVHAKVGPVAVIHWNAAGFTAGNLLDADDAAIDGALKPAIHGLLAAVRAGLDDLKKEKGGVLVTGGGLGLEDLYDAYAVMDPGAMGLAVAKAAQRKVVALLNKKLAPDGVYVGEIVVCGSVKGTASDRDGSATIDPADIAEVFFQNFTERKDASVTFE